MLFLIRWILEALTSFWALQDVGKGIMTEEEASRISTSRVQGESTQPSRHLLEGTREKYAKICVPLYYAALNGDTATVKSIANENPGVLNAAISNRNETVLHVAVRAKQVQLVKMLVNYVNVNMDLQDIDGHSAFYLGVFSGSSQIVEILLQKNSDLATAPAGGKVKTPFEMAALFGYREIAFKLYPLTKGILQEGEQSSIFFSCIHSGLYDLALLMLEDYPKLAVARELKETALHVLARKPPKEFAAESEGILNQILNFFPCTRFLISKKYKQSQALVLVKELWKQVLLQKGNEEDLGELIGNPTLITMDAAEAGNYEFLVAVTHSYHDLLWQVDRKERTIFHIAVIKRNANIFRLIHEIGSIKDLVVLLSDDKRNSILHLAAQLPATERLQMSGAALQMQSELLWFEEVKDIFMHPGLWEQEKNADNETAQSLFSRKHKDLLKEGEEWMKKTAESCTIVAALIATVVFSTAFSVPGGNSGDTGIPIQIKNNLYAVFSISNGIAMFSSSTSILMFLSILTSRYAERDFIRSLPRRLMIGLSSLFVSMATMTVAFCMAFFIAYRGRSPWIPVLVAALQLVPVSLFLYLLYPLLRDIFYSTFLSRSVFHPSKRVLHSVGAYPATSEKEKGKLVPVVSERQV